MENYKHMSIKSSERRRRADKPPGRLCEVVSAKQPLPDMEDFFTNLDNKISLQNFFVKYHMATYKSSKPLFIAGGLVDDPKRCTQIKNGYVKEKPLFRASHEEADDRIMYTIQQLYQKNPHGSISVVTNDTDIFVVLLYHLNNNEKNLNLFLFRKGQIKIPGKLQNELIPLHLLIPDLDPNVENQLPAGHSLTRCDTVAKVGTKNALLKALEKDYSLISSFGHDRLDGDAIRDAEQFLGTSCYI